MIFYLEASNRGSVVLTDIHKDPLPPCCRHPRSVLTWHPRHMKWPETNLIHFLSIVFPLIKSTSTGTYDYVQDGWFAR